MNDPVMTSQRPYLLRALWEWILANGMTPHILVDAAVEGVRVPPHTVSEGKVVLNIADRAVQGLELGDEHIVFNARFGGVRHAVIVPVNAVLAIYCRETGQGMSMPDDLHLYAGDAASSDDAPALSSRSTALASVPEIADAATQPEPPDDDTPPPPRRGGHLRVVK